MSIEDRNTSKMRLGSVHLHTCCNMVTICLSWRTLELHFFCQKVPTYIFGLIISNYSMLPCPQELAGGLLTKSSDLWIDNS